MSNVEHPAHYGGAENPYEVIKVIEALGLGFHLGNTFKYMARAGKKNPKTEVEDLEKAAWYLRRKIDQLKMEQVKFIEEPRVLTSTSAGTRVVYRGPEYSVEGWRLNDGAEGVYLTEPGPNGLATVEFEWFEAKHRVLVPVDRLRVLKNI